MNLGQIRTEVREAFGFPDPIGGGDDYLVTATINKYINDAFRKMVNAVGGLATHIEFTITTSGVITITVPAGSTVTDSRTSLDGGAYYAHKLSNLKSWGDFVNITNGIQSPEPIIHKVFHEHTHLTDYAGTAALYDGFDFSEFGFILMPRITQTNIISMDYKKAATAMSSDGDSPDTEIEAEYHNAYPVFYAAKMLCLTKGDNRYAGFDTEAKAAFEEWITDFTEMDNEAPRHRLSDIEGGSILPPYHF